MDQHHDRDETSYTQELERRLAAALEQRQTISDELRTTSQLLKATLNHLPVVICGIDQNDGMIFLNKEFERITGYTAAELLGRPDLASYLFPGQASPPPGAHASAREWVIKNRDQKDRVISWSDIQDCPIPTWSRWKVGLDITHLKQLERLRDDVESIVRHDMKSPLGAIIGMSSWLIEDDTLSEQQKKAIRMIMRGGERMLAMLENSLALYKIEVGEYVFCPQPVNLVAVFQEVSELLLGLQDSYCVRVNWLLDGRAVQEQDTFFVPGVESLLADLLTNLVKNAIEASPEGTIVTVNLSGTKTHARLDIHNQGVIPEAIRDRFFERFVTCGKTKGTGIGTYAARMVAEAHHGSISFTTSTGEGTHLLVTLPRSTAA